MRKRRRREMMVVQWIEGWERARAQALRTTLLSQKSARESGPPSARTAAPTARPPRTRRGRARRGQNLRTIGTTFDGGGLAGSHIMVWGNAEFWIGRYAEIAAGGIGSPGCQTGPLWGERGLAVAQSE